AQQPKAQQPKAQQPKAQQPKAQQPKAQQPKAQQPKAQQPKAQQPKAQQPKVPSKVCSKAKTAVQTQAKSKTSYANILELELRPSYIPTPRKQVLDRLAFVIANNNLECLRPDLEETGVTLNEQLISDLGNSNFPQDIKISHKETIKFVGDIYDIKSLTVNMTEALENIAYRINRVRYFLTKKEKQLLLMTLARAEPFTIPLLICFEMVIRDLTSNYNFDEFTAKDIIDMTYATTKAARPITGNICVALEKLVSFMMSKISIDTIVSSNLLPRVIKILHFMEICQTDFKIDAAFKKAIMSSLEKILKSTKPESSAPHLMFLERLKIALADKKGIVAKNEYLCRDVGTHLDIAIPQLRIAIEINGSAHYNADLVTENTETKFKRELLEAFDWRVVPVNVADLTNHEESIIESRLMDDIIASDILPLLAVEAKKKRTKLAAEANRHFYICQKNRNSSFQDYKTAKEYIRSIDKIEDPQEAAKRYEEQDQEMLSRKPVISYNYNNSKNVNELNPFRAQNGLKASGRRLCS
ncbi:MAG: hypothetical protein AB7I18_11245, partial [Candidatus Berkiella sp.]